ncbi:MAG: DHH family phosphoesterase [Candidatus Heimdallarchaeota archaeon]|nr:DHH family phosphoesterase [Candidatus Heimdallarchaeota archaeon]
MEDRDSFFTACKTSASEIINQSSSPIYIFTHFDPDGLTAGSIIASALRRESKPFILRTLKRLEYSYLGMISETIPQNSTVIFCDLGSGVIDAFLEWDKSVQIFILDHHSLPREYDLPENIKLVNPHLYSIDGTNAISGSGVAYFVAININPINKDLSNLAIIGALGDRQDQGENSSLMGLNELIIKDAVENKVCTDYVSLWFFDRSRDLFAILRRLNIEELNDDVSISMFLKDIGLSSGNKNGRKTFQDLNEPEKKKLASELIIKYMVDSKEIYKHDYQLVNEKDKSLQDARVFASRLNACGRLDRPEIAIALCMGDRQEAIAELDSIKREYSRKIGKGIHYFLSEGKTQEMTAVYFLDGRGVVEEDLIGPITSVISSMQNYKSKPVLSCATIDETRVKISMRKIHSFEKKIDLDKILVKAVDTLEFVTEVGGHSSAAGAIVKNSQLDNFVDTVNAIITEVK